VTDLGLVRKIILKLVSKKWDVKISGYGWLKTESKGVLLRRVMNRLVHERMNILES